MIRPCRRASSRLSEKRRSSRADWRLDLAPSRLGLALEMGLERPLLERLAAALSPEDAEAVCRGWQRTLRALYPAQTQLESAEPESDEAYLI